jgi:hypothetical protein
LQLLSVAIPFRYCYPNELFWTEEGFRFSCVMLMVEKAGYATFTVKDAISMKKSELINSHF